MALEFRNAQVADLPTIMTIENAGFTPDEAATEDSMRERIARIPDTFIVATEADQVCGYIVGPAINERYLYDELFAHLTANDANAQYLSVLSLAVAPDAQGQGIGGQLLVAFADRARAQGRRGITLTCLKRLVPFYEAHGYVNEGVADSAHAGETWYNMVSELG
jgi:ribosomal protein S18 acetylase RimI-like enzyme